MCFSSLHFSLSLLLQILQVTRETQRERERSVIGLRNLWSCPLLLFEKKVPPTHFMVILI